MRPQSTNAFSSSHFTNKQKILAAALPHVHAHGWTERAIAEGVLTSNLPPSYIGLIVDKQSEVIHYFMNDCNEKLAKAFQEKNIELENLSHSQVIEWGIRTRLEMNIPYVRSQRWHEGMALGAMPFNALETANHLEKMVKIIESGIRCCPSSQDSKHPGQTNTSSFGSLERGAIGAVYVATELHLLSDGSADYQDTWSFLKQRVQDLENAANGSNNLRHFPSSDVFVSGAAVASSLGGAIFSLLAPSTGKCGLPSVVAGSVVPQIMNFVQQPSSVDSTIGTKSQDYDFSDLPPFETDERKDEMKT